MRRVVMVSPHFPPDTSAGAHRVRLLAPHLPSFGWQPTVVSVDPAAYEGRLDPDLAHLVPDSVRVVRAGAWPAAITRRFGVGDLGLRALAGLRRACEDLFARERPDALFITVYPTYPAVLGPVLKRRHRVPFVLDYQDPWVGAWGRDVGGGRDGGPDWKSRATRAIAERIEPTVVRSADALTAVSARTYEDVLARVPDARPRACSAIPLGFEAGDLDALRRAPRVNPCFDARDGLVHVCYVGTLLPRGLEVARAMLHGVARLRERSPAAFARLRLHFVGTSNQRGTPSPSAVSPRVAPLAADAGVEDIVTESPGRLDYLDALNVQVQAHAVLLLGSDEPHYTPSKVFPAMLAGRPVVAFYHAASAVTDLLRCMGGSARLFTFDDPRSLAARADEIADAFAALAHDAMPRTIDRAACGFDAWSARALAGRLAGVLDAVARA